MNEFEYYIMDRKGDRAYPIIKRDSNIAREYIKKKNFH